MGITWQPLVPAAIESRFFVSYSHADQSAAEVVERGLITSGHEVWRDQRSLESGDRWRNEIDRALSACSDVIVILSASAARSDYVFGEVAAAVRMAKRIYCFSTVNIEEHPPWKGLIGDIQFDQLPLRVDSRETTAGHRLGAYIVEQVLAPAAKPHPLELRDFERRASLRIFPRFREIWRAGRLDRGLVERYSAHAARLLDQPQRCNAALALNAGILATHLALPQRATSCFELATRLGGGYLASYFHAMAIVVGIRPRHLAARTLDRCIELIAEAWKQRQSPLIALFLAIVMWDSGRGRGPNLSQLFASAIQHLSNSSSEAESDEAARFATALGPFERDLELPVQNDEFRGFLNSLRGGDHDRQ